MESEYRDQINRLSLDYMERFRNRDGPHYENEPWIAARVGWAEGYIAGRAAQARKFERYEELLRDVLDLTMIKDGHPRGIKALIKEALK